MSASVSFKEVENMLDACAPGWSYRVSNHSRVVKYAGKVFRNLPKQETIELGFVRSMSRLFGILECAKKQIASLST
jgi:hypothetical protein